MNPLTAFLPATTTRVESSTLDYANHAIHEAMVQRVSRIFEAGPAAIDRRLAELDQEWDIERALETGMATLSLTSLTLAVTVDKRWIGITGAVSAFLLMHALHGWCPPLIPLRHLGVRTEHEINVERLALRLLREDFRERARTAQAAISIANNGHHHPTHTLVPTSLEAAMYTE